MRTCNNCGKKQGCFYRGIINPCPQWKTDPRVKTLQVKVKACQKKRMNWWEQRFIHSNLQRQAYSPDQEIIIEQIYARPA